MLNTFCEGPFWDLNKTWYNDVPELASCFEDTALISFPSFLFSLIITFSFCRLPKRTPHHCLPWTWLNISKLAISSCLLMTSTVWLAIFTYKEYKNESSSISVLLAASARFLVFLLTMITILKHRRAGIITSNVLNSFWIVLLPCSIILLRSSILKYFVFKSVSEFDYGFILSMIHYPLIFLEFLLSLFTDKKNFNRLHGGNIMDKLPLLVFATFAWFNKVIHKSRKKILEVTDLSLSCVELTSSCTYALFARHWNLKSLPELLKSQNLVGTLIKSFWRWFFGGISLHMIYILTNLLQPLLLDRLIDFAHDDQYPWKGYFFATLLFIVNIMGTMLWNSCIYFLLNSGSQFSTGLMGAVFRKNFHLSTEARKDYASGAIMSLFTVDIKRILFFVNNVSSLLAAFLNITLTLLLLWQYLGLATVAAVVIVILFFPVCFYGSRYTSKFVDKQMESKDIRLKHLNETLSGIKILKLYAWEIPFSNKISDARKEEIKQLKYGLFCFIIINFVYFCAPAVVTVGSFAAYLYIDKTHVLTPTKAFVSINLINNLRGVIFNLPDAISEIIQCNVSFKRLKKYFCAENRDAGVVGDLPDKGDAISIRNASLSWTKDSFCTLNEINLHLKPGQLLAVIGPVGSGKSSLISSLLGELHKVHGSIDIMGTLAYVPQQAWILNRTVQENILLVKPMLNNLYNKIVDLCCLRPDLKILVSGDQTEIGEKGVNLSGGQKQRISLARAVFQDKDIYLLDDPLSAVDIHVRKALFNDVIGNKGLLKEKTRVLVTHEVSILSEVDLIVSMKDGRIDEFGTYDQLIEKKGSFQSFIEEHLIVNSEEKVLNVEKGLKDIHSQLTVNHINEVGSGDEMLNIQEEKSETKTDEFKLIENESMELGEVSYAVYWNYFKTAGLPLCLVVVLSYMVTVVLQGYGNIWVSQWSLDGRENGTYGDTTLWRLSVYSAISFADIVAVSVASGCLAFGSTIASIKFHDKMLHAILKSPMSFFDSTPMGRVVNRFSTDMDVMDVQIFYRFDCWLTCFFTGLFSFCVIGYTTPYFMLSLIPLGMIYYAAQQLHLNAMRQIRRLESTTRSPVYSHLLESIQGISSICAYKTESNFIQEFEEKVDRNVTCSFNVNACNRWLCCVLDFMGNIVMVSATMAIISNRENLNAAIIGLTLTYAIEMTVLLKWVVRMSTELEDKSISIERINEYCKLTPEAPWDCELDKQLSSWPQDGKLTFNKYSTRYREGLDLVLKEIDLSVNSCERVGVVGRTGAGKSSMTLALFRIIEKSSGDILIDNVNISELGLHKLRKSLTIIPQDPVLFTGTLRFNLDPKGKYQDDDIWKSLELSHLKEFVSSLKDGLDHAVDEGGGNLSAGQRQLLCLSRALMKKSKILVMDEATASVDMETDSLIQSTIRTAFANNTVITIAHRINTILDYDKIVVLDCGKVVEVGAPAALQQDLNSKFYAMCKEAGLI